MAVDVAVIQQALNTSTGTQDFTKSGFGTPKAAFFFLTLGVTNGTGATHACMAIGASDGTRQWVVSGFSEDNVTTTDTYRRAATDEVVQVLNTTGAIDGEANFHSFITDGVRLNIGDAFVGAYLLTVMLFGGSDLSVYADDDSHTAGQNVQQDFTGLGSQPDIVLFASRGAAFDDTSNGDLIFSFGCATNGGTIKQGCLCTSDDDGDTTTTPTTRIHDDRVSILVNANTGNVSRSLEYTESLSTGFGLTARESGTPQEFGYLALDCGGAINCDLNHFTLPNTTGAFSRTTFGWTPQAVMLVPTFCTSLNARKNTGGSGAGSFAVSAFDDTQASCCNITTRDNVSTSETQSLTHDRPVYMARDTGAVVYNATYTSMDASGYTLNFATANATSHQCIEIGFEENTGAPPAGPPLMHAMAGVGR